MSRRHMYFRDYSLTHKPPFGCLMFEVDKEKNEIRYAFSVCSPQDKFSAKIAIDKANGRLTKKPSVVKVSFPRTSHDITRSVMSHILENNQVQSDENSRSYLAYSAASSWLERAKKYTTKENCITALVNAVLNK